MVMKNITCCTRQWINNTLDTVETVVKNKGKQVSSELKEKRINICKECPHFIKVSTTCKKCGCFMSVKTGFEGVKCPINKW